jgi:hypothetical protein
MRNAALDNFFGKDKGRTARTSAYTEFKHEGLKHREENMVA